MDANGVSGGWGGLDKQDGYTPKLTEEEYDEKSLQWRRDVTNYQAGVVLLSNVFQTAMNEPDPDTKLVQLSNLNSVVNRGIHAGAALLQRDAAYYPSNQSRVVEMGTDVDLLVEYGNQTAPAYQEKRSNDFSYTEEIAAYWGLGDIAKDINKKTGDIWEGVKESAKAASKEAQKFAWPIGLGLAAIALIILIKK